MLARADCDVAGLHLALFDFAGAEALQAEACEVARGVGFVPPIVSAGIDTLFTFARRHEPGRAERLMKETAAAAASTTGWHQWLWQLRLTQARAELALARDAVDEAVATATDGIEQSRAKGRPKYEALGLIARGARSACARANSRRYRRRQDCCERRGRTGDPALLLLALDALIGLDGTDELATRARAVTDSIYDGLPNEVMRQCFTESEVIRRIRARQ